MIPAQSRRRFKPHWTANWMQTKERGWTDKEKDEEDSDKEDDSQFPTFRNHGREMLAKDEYRGSPEKADQLFLRVMMLVFSPGLGRFSERVTA